MLSFEIFRRGLLVSQCRNFSYGKLLGCHYLRVSKKFMLQSFRGLCHNFLSKVFVSQCREISYGNPSVLCVRKVLVAKKFMVKKGGVSTCSVGNFSSHSAEEFRR